MGAQHYGLYPMQQSLQEFVYQPHYVAAPEMTEVDANTLAAAAAEVCSKLTYCLQYLTAVQFSARTEHSTFPSFPLNFLSLKILFPYKENPVFRKCHGVG